MIEALLTSAEGPLQRSLMEMKELSEIFSCSSKPNDRAARWARSLKWPFQKADVEKIVVSLERHKSTLALQFDVENLD